LFVFYKPISRKSSDNDAKSRILDKLIYGGAILQINNL